MLAVFAIVALAAAVLNGSKPAAVAVAACGVIALLIFLLARPPRRQQVGTLDDARQSFFNAEAVPQAGFWLQLIGALGLSITRHSPGDPQPEAAGGASTWVQVRRRKAAKSKQFGGSRPETKRA